MAGSRGGGLCLAVGDALPVLEDAAPDVRVINLETSITRSRDFAPGKAIHYRMSPGNVPCLAAVRPGACALANNHVLDFGRRGWRTPWTRCPLPGCARWAPGVTPVRPGGRRPSRCPVAAAW
jgi:Bacterial capsule synthesis protein PGA_cap